MRNLLAQVFATFALAVAPASADISVDLGEASTTPSPQPVGTTVIWIAAASSTLPGELEYQFSVRPFGEEYRILQDFSVSPLFDWTPSDTNGFFEVRVVVKNRDTMEVAEDTDLFLVTSRALGDSPVLSDVGHPLVPLYSAPACGTGVMRVRMQRLGSALSSTTGWKPCNPHTSMNFYLAGMRAESAYVIRHEHVPTVGLPSRGPIRLHTTGALPAEISFPEISTPVPVNGASSLVDGFLLHSGLAIGDNIAFPYAVDLNGEIVWYMTVNDAPSFFQVLLLRPVAGGGMLLVENLPGGEPDGLGLNQVLRLRDLAGNALRETNARRISDQLAALGVGPITSFHHEALPLPNGKLAVLCSSERILEDVQGAVGEVDIIGDTIVILDENWQVEWAWDSFDHMDINRAAVLGETCVPGAGGCPPLFLDDIANDWLHSNSIEYSPNDGNLLLSMRHQDWVVKINYANGLGDGHVVWRLGAEGDFSVVSGDPSPWFSHQHDAQWEAGGSNILSIYDNGNTRAASDPEAHSRGQVFLINERNMTAHLIVNADLGHYAFALGAAERLSNGNYHFTSGIVNPPPNSETHSIETLSDGSINSDIMATGATYRSFRMINLYTP